MPHTATDLAQYLDELARDARPGDRLPTIRELMRRFGASQMLVQRAFADLKARGLIESEVGRGTYFRADGRPAVAPAGVRPGAAAAVVANPPAPSAVKSVLLLRRSISIARGRVVVEGLQRRFSAEGHRVLEVSYTDPDDARTVLKGLQRFDACVVQSTFKTITIDLLAALKAKCEVLAIDGTALVGTDVDAVGMEWGMPLVTAVELLQQRGHTRIAYATTAHPFLASQLGLRSFEHLRATSPGLELRSILLQHLPDDEGYEAGVVAQLEASFDASGRPPFTALVVWGIENGSKFRRLLSDIGLDVPGDLSVVLLGHTNVANEHADFFDTIGCSVADQVEALHRSITARWADPARPHGVRLIPVDSRAGGSVATLPENYSRAASRRREKALGSS